MLAEYLDLARATHKPLFFGVLLKNTFASPHSTHVMISGFWASLILNLTLNPVIICQSPDISTHGAV